MLVFRTWRRPNRQASAAIRPIYSSGTRFNCHYATLNTLTRHRKMSIRSKSRVSDYFTIELPMPTPRNIRTLGMERQLNVLRPRTSGVVSFDLTRNQEPGLLQFYLEPLDCQGQPGTFLSGLELNNHTVAVFHAQCRSSFYQDYPCLP